MWWTRSKKAPTGTGEIKSRFDSLVSQVRSVAEMEDPIMPENIYTRSEMYSFAIFMLGRLLESEIDLRVFEPSFPDELKFNIPHSVCVQERVEMNLKDTNVISIPYDTIKMVHAIHSLFTAGFHSDWNDTNGTYYKELDLVVIINGRHHVTAGRLYHEGSAKVDIYSLAPAFDKLRTDGVDWYVEGKKDSSVQDYRFAAMYEFARLRAVMLSGTARAAQCPTHDVPKLDVDDDAANWRLLQELELAQQENYVLKQDNQVKSQLIQELRQQIKQQTGNL